MDNRKCCYRTGLSNSTEMLGTQITEDSLLLCLTIRRCVVTVIINGKVRMAVLNLTHKVWKWLIDHCALRGKIDGPPTKILFEKTTIVSSEKKSRDNDQEAEPSFPREKSQVPCLISRPEPIMISRLH